MAGKSGPGIAYVRPQDVEVRANAKGKVVLREAIAVGPVVRLEAELGDGLIEVELPAHAAQGLSLSPGKRLSLTALRGHVYPA